MKGVGAGFSDDVHEGARHTAELDIGVGAQRRNSGTASGSVAYCTDCAKFVVEATIDEAGVCGLAAGIDHKGACCPLGTTPALIWNAGQRYEQVVDVFFR